MAQIHELTHTENRPESAQDTGQTRLLTVRKTAELLQISVRTVWSLIERGKLPVVRIGRSTRLLPADLEAFIRGNRHE